MGRVANWERRFAVQVDNGRTTGFVFGQSDCCLWPADVVRAVTGFDPARRMRGQYRGPKGALALIGRRAPTIEALIERMAAKFAVPELSSVKYAQRADIGIVRPGEDLTFLHPGFDVAVAVCGGPWWLIKVHKGFVVLAYTCQRLGW